MKNNVSIIYKKEMSSFFNSPMAYIYLVGFLLISAWLFCSTFFLINQSDLRQLFGIIPLIYIFFVPAVTMGLVAKERDSGTMELLTTMPLSDTDIIMGKYLAAVSLIGIALLFSLVHFFTLLLIGNNIDVGALISGYFGLLLLGGVYSAIGVFGSSVTNNQISALIISFLIVFVFFILNKIIMFVPGFLSSIVQYLSVDYHLEMRKWR